MIIINMRDWYVRGRNFWSCWKRSQPKRCTYRSGFYTYMGQVLRYANCRCCTPARSYLAHVKHVRMRALQWLSASVVTFSHWLSRLLLLFSSARPNLHSRSVLFSLSSHILPCKIVHHTLCQLHGKMHSHTHTRHRRIAAQLFNLIRKISYKSPEYDNMQALKGNCCI